MADTPVLVLPGVVGTVNAGGGGTLKKVEGEFYYGLGVSTVQITGLPFEPVYYYVGGYYTFRRNEECGHVMEERGLHRVRYTAGEDTGGNGNYYVDVNTTSEGFISSTYDNGTLTITVSPPWHDPREYIVWG